MAAPRLNAPDGVAPVAKRTGQGAGRLLQIAGIVADTDMLEWWLRDFGDAIQKSAVPSNEWKQQESRQIKRPGNTTVDSQASMLSRGRGISLNHTLGDDAKDTGYDAILVLNGREERRK